MSYFLSDGDPEPDDAGLDNAEESTWTSFLNTNDIQSIAVGIGSGIVDTSQLDRIAYDGRGAGTNTNGLILTDLAALEPTLVSTALTASGNIAADNGNGFGADGGHVNSITAEGTIYTYNPTSGGSVSVVGTNHGTFNTTDN